MFCSRLYFACFFVCKQKLMSLIKNTDTQKKLFLKQNLESFVFILNKNLCFTLLVDSKEKMLETEEVN